MLDLVQDVTFETDSLTRFEPMLRAAADAIGAEHLARCRPELVWDYPSHATAYMLSFLHVPPLDIARYTPPDKRPPAHYLAICKLADEPRWAPYDESIAVENRAQAVERALALVRAADTEAFERTTGEGPFDGADGTTGIGYRLHGRRGEILVALCHIYYSK